MGGKLEDEPEEGKRKRSWLESPGAYNTFLWSSWIIVLLAVAVIFMLTPWIHAVQGPTRSSFFVRTIGASIGVASVLAGPTIFLGMAAFCAIRDRSRITNKVLWVFLFFLTACFG